VHVLPGSEGAGDREEDDFLVGPLLAGVVLLRTAARGWVGVSNGSPSISIVLAVPMLDSLVG
jgi:hypothetical protein